MNKTLIEWVRNPDGSQGYTWNPVTGCLNHKNGLCKGGGFPCYAYRLANGRLRQRYLANHEWTTEVTIHDKPALLDPFYPRFWPERLNEPYHLGGGQFGMATIPKGIFVCDMGELFGDWVRREWQEDIFQVINNCPQHRFYLLTKQPQNLILWSPFPENCWVGVTACNARAAFEADSYLANIKARVKYVSLEPLLKSVEFPAGVLACLARHNDWLIIGAMTGRRSELVQLSSRYPDLTLMPWGRIWTLQPKREWVAEIVNTADKAHVKVFLKNNLKPLFPEAFRDREWAPPPFFMSDGEYRQEMPNGQG